MSKKFMAVCKYSVKLAAKESAIYPEIHVLTKKTLTIAINNNGDCAVSICILQYTENDSHSAIH